MSDKFKNFRIFYLFIFIISISLSGCSWIPFFGDDEEEVELESNAEGFEGFESDSSLEMEDMRVDLKNLQSQQEEAQVRIEEFERTIENLKTTAGSEQVEELKDTIQKLQSDIAELQEDMAQKQFESKLKSKPGRSVKSNYDKALRLYNIKQYRESLRVFKSIDNRKTPVNLRDNVIFWIGKCYFKLENFDKAIEKFETVISDYKNGNKSLDSMYAAGETYHLLGEKSKALDYLEKALSKKPSADLRRKIERKIEEING